MEVNFICQYKYQQNMSEQQREPKGINLLLPPIRLYERSHTTNQLINQYMNIIHNKKIELYRNINETEVNRTHHQLKYVKDHLQDSKHKKMSSVFSESYQEQLLARGNIQEEKVYTQQDSSNLLKKQLNYSTIQSHQRPKRQRVKTKTGTTRQKEDVGEVQVYKFNRRYQTQQRIMNERESKDETSPAEKYRLLLFNKQPKIEQKKQEEDEQKSNKMDSRQKQNTFYLKAQKHIEQQEGDDNELTSLKTEQIPSQKQQIDTGLYTSPIHIIQQEKIDKTFDESQIKSFITLQKKSNLLNPQQSVKMMAFHEAITVLKKSTKTNERLQKAVIALQGFNPFFKKIQKVIAVCLLRIGKIIKKESQYNLYQMKIPYRCFFIILTGKVEIKGKEKMRKTCQTGETLLEQILFEQTKNSEAPVSLEKAKLTEQSWLLQVDLSELAKLQKQLIRYGFRLGLNELKNILKRNYIVKNWLRSKFKHISYH